MFFRKPKIPLVRHGPDISTLRTVYLVRHGQYKLNPEKLTALGRKQATIVARTLSKLKFTQFYCSTMPRAFETASLIAKKTKVKPVQKEFLREGVMPGSNHYDPQNPQFADENAVREAFQFIFLTPEKPSENCLVVAHGNVIRHWVCMLLETEPAEKWKFLEPGHTSITTVRVREDGKLTLLGFSDVGHLPLKVRST